MNTRKPNLRTRRRHGGRALPLALAPALLLLPVAPAFADEAAADDEAVTLPTVVVVSPTPAGGATVSRADYPGNLQTASSRALEDAQATNLAEFLGRQFDGVHLSEASGNPFQPDLFYRGYSVSPLLGLPQGLAVYQDGVRINEVFGDTVNWDLIPEQAIAGIVLVPDSNPLFGQNAIGGSLTLQTKNGFDYQGSEIELLAGSFGRRSVSADYGVAGDTLALYLAAQAFEEDGWRDHSASRVEQLFARGSWRPDDRSQYDLSLTAVDNRLRGNGAAPVELLDEEGRDAVFTHPDQTDPRLLFFNAAGQRRLDDTLTLAGTLYRRNSRVGTFNGDGTEYTACTDPANVDGNGTPLLCETGNEGEDVVTAADGLPVVAGDVNDSATQNRSRTRQLGRGGSLQLAWRWQPGHELVLGSSLDYGRADFRSHTELGALTEDRGTTGSGIVVEDSQVHVKTRNDNIGVYALERWKATEALQLSLGGRYNHTEVRLRDQAEDGDLSGDHRFDHFNPMLGASYRLHPHWTAFASATQATRAPTPVELTCANPDDPCKLPNGFVDDPPLQQVVTRTLSLGLRTHGDTLDGSAALFHALSHDDILFITDGNLTNQGYFDNVGKTLRQGLELGLHWKPLPGWSLDLDYTWLTAEFRESFLVNTPNHPARDDDGHVDAAARTVGPGDRLPLIPRHLVSGRLGWERALGALRLEAVGRSASRYRGDEANADDRELAGFVLFNLYGELRPLPRLTLFARAENLFDRDYETFGVYGEAGDVLGDAYEDAHRFVGPGAPRAFYAGVRINLGKTSSL